jgi:hypothetical protein
MKTSKDVLVIDAIFHMGCNPGRKGDEIPDLSFVLAVQDGGCYVNSYRPPSSSVNVTCLPMEDAA